MTPAAAINNEKNRQRCYPWAGGGSQLRGAGRIGCLHLLSPSIERVRLRRQPIEAKVDGLRRPYPVTS